MLWLLNGNITSTIWSKQSDSTNGQKGMSYDPSILTDSSSKSGETQEGQGTT